MNALPCPTTGPAYDALINWVAMLHIEAIANTVEPIEPIRGHSHKPLISRRTRKATSQTTWMTTNNG